MCKSVLLAYICMYHVCAMSQTRAEDGVESLGTRVTDISELPCRCWAPNPGLLQEQQVLSQPPSLLLSFCFHFCFCFWCFWRQIQGFSQSTPPLRSYITSAAVLPPLFVGSLVYLDRFWCCPGWNLHSQRWPWTSDSCLSSKCWDFGDVLPCFI